MSSTAVLSGDIRFWSAASKFAIELLARQRFVPTLDRRNGEFEAGWRPVLDDPRDQQRISQLVGAMPPVARALRLPDELTEPGAAQLLESFLDAAVDNVARSWLAAEANRRVNTRPPSGAGGAWFEALRRGNTSVRASANELDRLATRLAEWRAPLVTASSSSVFRTCFRLDPPTPPEGAVAVTNAPWVLRFFLQATDDLSLMLPAELIWRERGDTVVHLNRRFDQPQERLMADLSKAAQIFPPLDDCVSQPHPVSCELTTELAYRFLRETAWLLEEQGIGVLIPSWWDQRGPRGRLGLRLKLRPPANEASGLLGEHSLVEYDWRLAVGDVELSEADFRQLAALKVPLVCVRGQWVELRPDKIEQAITFWERHRLSDTLPNSSALALALCTD
jgi:hypothetical protein